MNMAEEMKILTDKSKPLLEKKEERKKIRIIREQERTIIKRIKSYASKGNYKCYVSNVKYLKDMANLFKNKGFYTEFNYDNFNTLEIRW